MLYATVRNRKIHVKRPDTVIQNGVNVDYLELDMDDEWKDMDSIVCVFLLHYTEESTETTEDDGGGTTTTTVITEKEVQKEMLHTFGQPVMVPWECLVNTGMLSVSCTGYVGGEKIMTTMYPDSYWEVVQNGPVSGEETVEPTATLYEQIVAAAGKANAAATAAAEVRDQILSDKANGVFDGADGLSASVRVGTTCTGTPGSKAVVTEDGTPQDRILNFTIPTGSQGPKGDRGEAGPAGVQGETGPQGPKGDTGATGPQGPKGDTGATGETGPAGADGYTPVKGVDYWTESDKQEIVEDVVERVGSSGSGGGSAGADGYSPSAVVKQTDSGAVITITDKDGTTTATVTNGADGATGPQGEKGETGPQGPKGDTGATGATGPQGPKGDKGDTGPAGADGTGVTILGSYDSESALNTAHPTGSVGDAYLVNGYLYVWSTTTGKWENVGNIQGPKGDKGDTGAQGPKGDTGAAGATGPQGPKGDTGDTGPQGEKGDTGATGPQGEKGDTGSQGPKGETGATGAAGKDGTSVTVSSVSESSVDGGENVVTFSDGKTLTVKNGSKGSAGAAGATGPAGADGYTPVKGVDYWTESDKQEILDEIGTEVTTVPDYVVAEAETVARTINQHQSNDSIVFPFLSDAHCGYYLDPDNDATKLAGQLLDLIGKRVPFDFIANGGDFANGAWDTTREKTYEQCEDYTELTANAHKGVPAVWMPGNHEDAPYMATADRATQTDMFALVGRKSRVSGAVCPNGCNYGYLDLENRRLRVIYLDTDDKRSWGTVQVGNGQTAPDYLNAHNIGGAQLRWLCATALDFSDKSDPAEWSIVVVSHVALNISGTITDAVSGTTYANSTANAATILKAYQTKKAGTIAHNDITVAYDFSGLDSCAAVVCCVHGHNHAFKSETVEGIVSIGCPNVMNGRERASDDGTTYSKTAGTADGTSFCVITIDRENCVIYADCVGAGYDREFTYTTQAVAYTNQLPLATDADGNIYNGIGYKENTYLSSGVEYTSSGRYTTGFIPAVLGDTLYCKNVWLQNNMDAHRLSFYDSSKNHLNTVKTSSTGYTGFSYGEDGNVTAITVKNSNNTGCAYVRFCCGYLGEDSIVTVNETIE